MKPATTPPRTGLRAILASCLLALSAPLAHAKTDSVSNEAWAGILSTYVSESADGVNRVDYAALKASPDALASLDAYIAQFADLDFASLPRDAQFSAWANLYNAVTVRYVVREYPIDTIKPWYSSGPWKKITVRANGSEVTLDGIEHDILRKQWSNDPRLHYAINCASYSCPNLRTRPWQADTLDADLNDAARAYINDPRGVTVRNNGIEVSSIYNWFEEDFGGNKQGVIDHLLKYADADLAAEIRAKPSIKGYEYDWSLNGTDN